MLNCDNIAVVYILNNNTSKDKHIMCLLRQLVLVCLNNNIFIRSRHIPGKTNVISDLLSRWQVKKAKELAPYLNSHPTNIPRELLLEHLLEI
jgi:hypothetical protein